MFDSHCQVLNIMILYNGVYIGETADFDTSVQMYNDALVGAGAYGSPLQDWYSQCRCALVAVRVRVGSLLSPDSWGVMSGHG
jgi:hypothetical protein